MIPTIALSSIVAAIQEGRPGEAERLCRLSLEQAPDDENLHLLLGICLQQQERHDEALIPYAWLTTNDPGSATHWTNYATALRMAGRPAESADAATHAIRLAPSDAMHHLALGLAKLQQSDHEAAQEHLLKACELDPESPLAHIHAANALVAVRDAQAYTLLRAWRAWLPLDPQDQLLLAHLLMTIGDANDAYDVLVELMARAPMNLPARLQMAALYERRNELDLAELLLSDTADHFPTMDNRDRLEMAHVRATLAMRRGNPAEARSILDDAGPRTPLDYTHFFNLADIQDKLGNRGDAMQSLAKAHALQVEELTPIAPARFAADAQVLPNAVGRLGESDHAAWPSLIAPTADQSPLFIVGFPRSGTTLLEQMLDAHPALQSMDERPFFTIMANELLEYGVRMPDGIGKLNQKDCDELRGRYYGLVADKIRRAPGTRLVDKNPLNMLMVPLIKRLFPHSKFILALRHPCDVVLSNYMQNYRSTLLAGACSTLERTAMAYVAAMQSWLYHADFLQGNVLVSRYEDLVGESAMQTRKIADFLGLENAAPMLAHDSHARDKGFIATPSYTEVIKPVSRKSIDRWRRYQGEFESVLPILKPMLDHWGYAG
ncbi:MAG: sulfotransferase [Dokdonella sp.]|uniref:tetratricopeptide repeat-containing sulfotransferase family protein n=1 Tax=Dokdonella sp. TaxID=2291710 RepID=UPI003265F839